MTDDRDEATGSTDELSDQLAAPLDEAPPVPADDPEIGADGVGAGDLP